MSSIGWIDFSSEHRDKVRTVIDFLSAPGVLDELGIGVIRDSFADQMFPGITTIQTRAKYFTMIAIMLRDYQEEEKPKRRPKSLERYLEEHEKWCRIQLVEAHGEGRQNLGIIGGTFGLNPQQDVIRKPSSIYWNGLRQFGFVSPKHLSLAEFSRRLQDEGKHLRSLLNETSKERGDDADAENREHLIRIHAPEVSDDYWDKLTIELNMEEATFLRDQITTHQSQSLIGQILMDDDIMDEVLQLPEDADFEDFSTLPFISELKQEKLRQTVDHAHNFSFIMEGDHIRYNCLLQERFGTAEKRKEFEVEWEEWRQQISDFPKTWDTEFMWQTAANQHRQIKNSTKRFVEAWIEQCREGVNDLKLCNALVTEQERLNKKSRARLRKDNNEGINQWVGLRQSSYRLNNVRQLLRDIWDSEI